MNQSRMHQLAVHVQKLYYNMDQQTRNDACDGHWWDHVVRVANNALFIVNRDEASDCRELVVAAALCHDIGYLDNKDNDTLASIQRCPTVLHPVGYSDNEISRIQEIMRGDDRDIKIAEEYEEKVLYIADKLDLFGTDGTIRLVIEGAREGRTVRHELAEHIANRQRSWFEYMMSLNVVPDIVESRYAEACRILQTLQEPHFSVFDLA